MTASAALQAQSVATAMRSSKRRSSSSKTKIAPASGALNAAASPAPAPAASSTRLSPARSLNARDHRWPMVAPICTVGPSRPSARPEPNARSPPTNFTGSTAAPGDTASPRTTASTCCTPLPAASGANRRTSQRERYAATAAKSAGASHPSVGWRCAQSSTASRTMSAAPSAAWNALPTAPASAPTASALNASASSPRVSSSPPRGPCACGMATASGFGSIRAAPDCASPTSCDTTTAV